MAVLNFYKANCKNCYKCLRNCPVKAISFIGENAQVIDDKCILCGHCVAVCPQNAKDVESTYKQVEALIASGRKVIASVAPSFVSSFSGIERENLFSAIGQLGFYEVHDTAEGAALVTEEYDACLKSGKFKNLITTACPAVVNLVKYSYHDAIKYMAPVVSPMVAHGKLIKSRHPDAAVVFIGPCIAKKREAKENNCIETAITFEELAEWFEEKNIKPAEVENDGKYHPFYDKSLFYPVPRGIIKSFYGYSQNYDYIYVDGVDRCKEVLANIDNLSGALIEMSACENSCVNGPCSIKNKGGFIKANEEVRKFAKRNLEPRSEVEGEVELQQTIQPIVEPIKMPSELEIKSILAKIGKHAPEDELNCGACGYDTCRQKAVAVYNGLASLEMCLPYMKERAETMASGIIMSSPNGVIAVDNDLKITEINPIARELFGISDKDVKGKDLMHYMNPSEFILAMNGVEKIINRKVYIDKTDRYVALTIYNVEEHNMALCTAEDITKDEKYKQLIKKVQLDTAETTARVIEKQMSIVQEIASLLGETTAETKVALTKLKNAITDEYAQEDKTKKGND